MRLDDLRPTSNVDDRRGISSGHIALGGGGLGLVVLVVALLLGADPSQLLNGSVETNAPSGYTQTGPRQDDAALAFARKIVGSTEDVWTPILAARGIQYEPAILTPYDYQTPTGCGEGSASAGPFYCPEDRRVYIDLSFFNELKERFGAPGDFARAYVVAHEVGHNVQNVLGTMDRERGALESDSARGATGASVRLELQADCYAGVWARRADQQFHILEQGDVEEGLGAASAVGDDTLQKESRGYVVPDSFTHGTSEQRVRWFKRGLERGNMDDCNTFSAEQL
jgi:predicted metalloprotease